MAFEGWVGGRTDHRRLGRCGGLWWGGRLGRLGWGLDGSVYIGGRGGTGLGDGETGKFHELVEGEGTAGHELCV